MLGHMSALSTDIIKPMLAIIAVSRAAVSVIAREPISAFPSAVGAKFRTGRGKPVIKRAGFCLATCRPLNLREMHRIFMAVCLDRLGPRIDLIDMVGKTAWIDGPAVSLGLALNDNL